MDTRGKVILWLAGSGIHEADTTKILTNERVQFELAQEVTDNLGLYYALSAAASRLGHRICNGPIERLQFQMMDWGNNG